MKKFFTLALLLFVITFTSFADTSQTLVYYESDFRNSTPADPLGGWTCAGSGKEAKDVAVGNTETSLRDYFPQGSAAYVPINFNDIGIAYCSNSTTVEGGAANEWLISPAIDLSDAPENLMLAFDIISFGATNEPKYEIYISTTGNNPEDFQEKAVYAGKTTNNMSSPLCKREYHSFANPKGEKTYIAFVNKSRNAQILGFKDIKVSEYALNVTNSTPSYLIEPTDVNVNITLGIQTPVKCDGYSATLSYNGEEQVYNNSRQISTSYDVTKIEFPEPLHVDYGETIQYTITVTPNYEGATPTVLNYDLGCSSGYPSVCVEEEGTGTWCGWCIRGIAGLKQFSDEYGDRFIGIAVHSNTDDPMGITSYISNLSKLGISSFPKATFNRSVVGDPYDRDAVEKILDTPSGYAVRITDVAFDEEKGNLLTLKYAPKLAFTTSSADISAAVVVTEDGVSGKTAVWSQTNYYAGYTEDNITELYGEGAWPYFKEFCEASTTIRANNIKYDHVAMGIFNSFNGGGEGGTLPAEWVMDQEQEFTISFPMPMQTTPNMSGVQNWKNTHVIVMLLDNATGHVLSAAKVSANDYRVSGIDRTTLGYGTRVSRTGDQLDIETEGKASVEVFNMYGLKLYSSDFDGNVVIDGSKFYGPVLVKVSRENESFVKKIMF